MNQQNLHFMFIAIIFIQILFLSPNIHCDENMERNGELVILPDHGIVYIATDFHTHLRDFNQWLKRTKLIEKIKAGEDVYGLILGDMVDRKPGDPLYERLGDKKIINQIMRLQKLLKSKGERLICIKGNHELAAATTFAMLKKSGMNAKNRKRMIEQLYRSPQGAYFQQFNFIERMTDEQYDYLLDLPTAVVGKNGFVGIHAGISRLVKSRAELAHPTEKILEDLLWSRPASIMTDGYTRSQTRAFLKRIGGKILIVGHTPLSYFPKKRIKNGVALLGKHQLFFSTGYGASPGVRSYLVIDLSQKYESVSDLKYGAEIQPLYP